MKYWSIIIILIAFIGIFGLINSLQLFHYFSDNASLDTTYQFPLKQIKFIFLNSILLVLLVFFLMFQSRKLHRSNRELKDSAKEKNISHQKISQFAQELEAMVEDKTKQLQYANQKLRDEIKHRKRTEEKLEMSYERMKQILEETVNALISAVEKRDLYTAGHQKKVAKLSIEIGKALGFSEDQLEGLHIAAQLHDIGKISIPSEILSKPGKVSPAEYELIKTHVRAGYDILNGIKFPWPIAEIVLQHHEKYDGSGYPQGLKGDQIRMEAKILCLSNVVVAMTSHRPHVPQVTIEEALQEMKKLKGSGYDPLVVEACLALFRKNGFTLDD